MPHFREDDLIRRRRRDFTPIDPLDPEEDCFQASTVGRRPDGLKKWSLDTCPLVLVGMVVSRPEEHTPPGTVGATAGDACISTIHGARAVNRTNGPTDEPCVRHYGRVEIAPDGDARRFMCTNHMGDPETHEVLRFIGRKEHLAGPLVRPGDAAMVTTLRAPDWREAIYFSHKNRCIGFQE